MNTTSVGHSWNDVRKELFTAEEIAECDLQVALTSELIKAHHLGKTLAIVPREPSPV